MNFFGIIDSRSVTEKDPAKKKSVVSCLKSGQKSSSKQHVKSGIRKTNYRYGKERMSVMKKNSMKILAGAMILSMGLAGLLGGAADAYGKPAILTYDLDMLKTPSIEDFIGEWKFLTESEKNQLLQDEKQAAPLYEKAGKIYEKIDEISEKIFAKHQELFDRYDELLNRNQELWQKMVKNETAEQENTEDSRSYIKASKVITEEEKKILLEVEDQIDALNEKIDAIYEEIDKATAELAAEAEEYEKQAEAIHEKSRNIWDKIYGQPQTEPLAPKDIITY